ncbi:hypothetical protein HDU76_013857 [Blyttiomyces sp. JEL0837]|nr:hypothetical protein HDU76_013857 [Blyttiomyces sp. JEL0837]
MGYLDAIKNYIEKKDFQALLEICENLELEFPCYPMPPNMFQQNLPSPAFVGSASTASAAPAGAPATPSAQEAGMTTPPELPLTPSADVPPTGSDTFSFPPASSSTSSSTIPVITDPNADIIPYDARIYIIQYFVHLIQGSLHLARFLVKRSPTNALQSQDFIVLTEIGESLMARNYAEALHKLSSAPLTIWNPLVVELAKDLVNAIRARSADLLERGVDAIEIPRAAMKLGISEAEMVEFAARKGWKVDENGWIEIVRVEKKEVGKGPGIVQISDLAEFAVQLERAG